MADLTEYFRCGMKHRHSRKWFGYQTGYQMWCVVIVAIMLVGCAPALYSVDMKYVPTRSFPKTQGVTQPIALTVAAFQDARKIADNMLIGRVIKPNGEQIRVLPKFVKPSQAVTEPIKEFFRQAGYRVATESPAWDLQEAGINKGWGPIIVGGSIDELDVVCQNSLTVTKYQAKVKLTIYFADTVTGKIFHTFTADSSTSLDHVLFSEEMLAKQINTALAGAIEKFFEGRDMANIINKRGNK
ncbi:MAG: hypothetical protein NT140_07490 [Deltaproteobacteria bacterium]|nr:hypothetical protein [Deltaproteobacteria bacterium]